MYVVPYPIITITLILWIGFLLAISFMEAWLKFRAPGVTLAIGLGIGRIIFNTLNKIEWIFLCICGIITAIEVAYIGNTILVFLACLSAILMLQTFWLLPKLDARAERHIQGMEVEKSYLHICYFLGETFKLIILVLLIINTFK